MNDISFGLRHLLPSLSAFALVACGPEAEPENTTEIDPAPLDSGSLEDANTTPSVIATPNPPQEVQIVPPKTLAPPSLAEAEIQTALKKTNPGYEGQGVFHKEGPQIIAAELAGCGLKDLAPLRGLQLKGLDLSGNPLRDLRHLRGMPIVTLYLENTEIVDLRPLQGMPIGELRLNQCSRLKALNGLEGAPLQNLYLPGTKVVDLTPLQGAPIRQLWLNDAPVEDMTPLKNAPLISLTLHRTNVSDLSFVRDLPLLQRLHIGETKVSDLGPLKGLALTRLVFTPNQIEKGIEQARRLRGLNEIGARFDDQSRELMAPAAFWAKYDQGAFK